MILDIYLVGCFVAGMMGMFYNYQKFDEAPWIDIVVSLLMWSSLSWFAVAAELNQLNRKGK